MIEHDDADMVIAGGTDSCLSEFSVAGFYLLGALSENNSSPSRASRPFDLRRNGFVLAEGAGILVVEELQHARERGAPILAELKGFGATSNSYRITDSPPEGRGPTRPWGRRSGMRDYHLVRLTILMPTAPQRSLMTAAKPWPSKNLQGTGLQHSHKR